MFREIKDRVKYFRDSLYSKSIPGKITFGKEDTWTILTHGLNKPIVYSGGVGKNISFEIELVRQFDAQVFLYDPSDTGSNTMKGIPSITGLNFEAVALSNHDGIIKMFLPVNAEEGSYTKEIHKTGHETFVEFPCRKISSLMKERGHTWIDILKLDIEGAEYEVLEDVLLENLDIGQICVEFHHFFDNIPKSNTQEIMARLRKSGYEMIHRHELDYLFINRKNFPSL